MCQSGIDVLHLQASLALFGPWTAFGQQRPFPPDLRQCQVSATAVIRPSRLTDGSQSVADLAPSSANGGVRPIVQPQLSNRCRCPTFSRQQPLLEPLRINRRRLGKGRRRIRWSRIRQRARYTHPPSYMESRGSTFLHSDRSCRWLCAGSEPAAAWALVPERRRVPSVPHDSSVLQRAQLPPAESHHPADERRHDPG